MGRTEPWPTPCVQSRRKGPAGRLGSAEDEGTARRGSQDTKEQTVLGRKPRSRSNDDAGSSVVFIEFGRMASSDLSQVISAECWGRSLTTMRMKREVRAQRQQITLLKNWL